MPATVTARLRDLGYTPVVADAPVGTYVSTARIGNLLLVSGQISQAEGAPAFFGRLGDGLSVEDGVRAAQSAALGLVAQIVAAAGEPLDAIVRVVRLRVFIASTVEFTQHATVADGASKLMVALWGEAGHHVRTAVGVASLPAGVAVELDADVELAAA